jgi:putative ABC transport system ATP-binding protein
MREAVVRAEQLEKTYGSGHTAVKALQGASMVAHRGELVALLGPSGSGKSTLLTALGLLTLPEKGRITLAGQEVVVDGAARADLPSLRRNRIGFVFQKSNLIPFLTARENVRVALKINGQDGPAGIRRAQELLEALGVGGRSGHYPEQLSGGEQQRVAIARALAMAPPLILADEPTSALDSHRGREVMELFRRVAHEHGAAIIVVTHDHRTLDIFDTIFEMEDGILAPARPHGTPPGEIALTKVNSYSVI